MSSTYDFQNGFCQGAEAAEKNLPKINPHKKDTEKYRGWIRGYNKIKKAV